MRSRSAIGHVPKDADGLIYETDDETHPLFGWQLYRRSLSHHPWVSLKLIRPTQGKSKANYWLGWHLEEHRISRTYDRPKLSPEMREAVETVMRDWYPSWFEVWTEERMFA